MWELDIVDGGARAHVVDHTGARITTLENDGSGFSQRDVLREMRSEVRAEGMSGGLTGGLSDRQIRILADAVFEAIDVSPAATDGGSNR